MINTYIVHYKYKYYYYSLMETYTYILFAYISIYYSHQFVITY